MIEMGEISANDIYVVDNEFNVFRDFNDFFDYHLNDMEDLNNVEWQNKLIEKYGVVEMQGQQILLNKIEEQRQQIANLKERVEYLETKDIDPDQIQMDL